MVRFLLFVPLAAGCLIYDTHEKDGRAGADWGDSGGERTDAGERTDTGEPAASDDAGAAFTLDPASGAIGSTLIASLTASDEFDFSTVSTVQFYTGVDVIAYQPRDAEILLSLSIPPGTTPRTADVLVLLESGEVEFLPGAFVLEAAGEADADGDGDGDGGRTDTGGSGGDTDCP